MSYYAMSGRKVKVKTVRKGGGLCFKIFGITIGCKGKKSGCWPPGHCKNKWKKKHGHKKHHWWNDREDHWWDDRDRRWKPHNRPDQTFERFERRAPDTEIARQYGLTYYQDDYGIDYMRGLRVRVV